MWIAIAVVCGLSSLGGYAAFQDSSPDTSAFVLAFAAGAILTMLANTMMPEAFKHGGKLVGVVTTLGFAVAYGSTRSREASGARWVALNPLGLAELRPRHGRASLCTKTVALRKTPDPRVGGRA